MFKQSKLLFLYTETPLHVGSGSSLGIVDLPIQREKHTKLPMIQSSGIKGKLRNAFENNGLKGKDQAIKVIFGPENNSGSEHAGALSPGDGRILLFPVRSLAGVFAWVTCPLVISRFVRDLKLSGQSKNWSFEFPENQAIVPNGSKLLIDNSNDNSIVLEEFTFTAKTDNAQVQDLANWLADNALPSGDEYEFWRNKLKKDLAVISDDAFKDFCQFSTDVVSRTKLNSLTKTVDKEIGGLWTEENLPSDSLLYTPLFACDPRIGKQEKEIVPTEVADAGAILTLVQNNLSNGHSRLQLGGNETVGRGIVATRVL